MGLFSSLFSKEKYSTTRTAAKVRLSQKQGGSQRVGASYDSAADTDYLKRHWANTDALSADAANTREIRRKIMQRARYEFSNNSYCAGMVLTLANDVIGTGARLQIHTGNPKQNSEIEAAFRAWSKAINLSEKLRTMRQARTRDGEVFAKMFTNRALSLRHPVTLDLQLIEAEQVSTPDMTYIEKPNAIDGIVFDEYGNPKEYHVLKSHPGSTDIDTKWNEYSVIPADEMLHYFRADRPGQHRGVSEYKAALPLFAMLRNYSTAVLKAAETAADFAGVIQSNAPAVDSTNDFDGTSAENGTSTDPEVMDVFNLEQGMLTVLPRNWTVGQVRAEQPTTTYADFKKEILNEIARCLNMPFNVAAGNSSSYNYASGRLDHQTYFKCIDVDRDYTEYAIMDRIFEKFINEYYLAKGLPKIGLDLTHQWFWGGHEHVDPAKEAKAQETRLGSLTTTLASEYAKDGKDWEEELRQRAREMELQKELGLVSVSSPDDNGDRDDEDEKEDEE